MNKQGKVNGTNIGGGYATFRDRADGRSRCATWRSRGRIAGSGRAAGFAYEAVTIESNQGRLSGTAGR